MENAQEYKYTVVSVDIDTTGCRLIDEIVQLCAYNPKSDFSQYVMPYMNLNTAARQRHQLRVITIGLYRMLKCTRTYKILKSKSEYAALKDFLTYLETFKKTNKSNGVILIYHEKRKFLPYMLLEAFKKYNLLERFLETVKSFANAYDFAKVNCPDTIKNYSLRTLSKVLLSKHEIINFHEIKNSPKEKKQIEKNQYFEGSASVRAKLAFEIYQHLNMKKDENTVSSTSNSNADDDNCHIIALNEYITENMLKNIIEFAKPVSMDLNELENQKKILERQNSFRPVFVQYFKTTLYHRLKAVKFRIILSEDGHDHESLQIIWNEKRKEGLNEVIQAIISLKIDEKAELVEILDSHFDPSKQPIKPATKKFKNRNRRSKNKENEKPTEGMQSGDGEGVTTRSSPDSSTNDVKTSNNRLNNHSIPN